MFRTAFALLLLGGAISVSALPSVGDRAPDFRLLDQYGQERDLASLRGHWVALAFYPKSMTSGCTVQNREFTEQLPKFEKLGVRLLAVSVNSPDEQKRFCEKENLKHAVLADPEGLVATAYGVMTERGTASRTTFVIAPDGRIAKVFTNVDPKKSAVQILEFVEKASGPPEFHLKDTAGKEYRLSEIEAQKGILIFFVSPRCPISRAYDDRMNALAEQFQDKGFVILGIDSCEPDTDEEIREMAGRMRFPILVDRGSVVADLFRTSYTPEVILLDPQRKLIYRGGIDDQSEPSRVTKHYLKEVLEAVSEGRPVPFTESRAFGCTIKRPARK